MYWNNLEVDIRTYPAHCPGCEAPDWQDRDWETGLIYCVHCGWYAGDDDAQSNRSPQE